MNNEQLKLIREIGYISPDEHAATIEHNLQIGHEIFTTRGHLKEGFDASDVKKIRDAAILFFEGKIAEYGDDLTSISLPAGYRATPILHELGVGGFPFSE